MFITGTAVRFSESFEIEGAEMFAHACKLMRSMSGWPQLVYLLRKPAGEIGAGSDIRKYERHWTPIHFDVIVGDLDAAVRAARRWSVLLARRSTGA